MTWFDKVQATAVFALIRLNKQASPSPIPSIPHWVKSCFWEAR
jgi:hypothetical protein